VERLIQENLVLVYLSAQALAVVLVILILRARRQNGEQDDAAERQTHLNPWRWRSGNKWR